MRTLRCPSAVRALAAVLVLTPVLPVPSARAAGSVQATEPARSAASARSAAASARRPSLVFADQFRARHWGRRGALWTYRTTAYPDGTSDRGDSKLDQLRNASMRLSGGAVRITATATSRNPGGPWQTGLLTTEPWGGGRAGGRGFQLRTGDYALVRLQLPGRADGGGHGAWPGVWTWRGGNEVDLLEWHSERPDVAEFCNHTYRTNPHDFFHSRLMGFGKWIDVGVRFGAKNVSWYLGDDTHRPRLAYQDHVGVGASWHAYLIANLSVSDQPGRVPTSTHPITMSIDRIQVYR
jgi:hypothetical protein